MQILILLVGSFFATQVQAQECHCDQTETNTVLQGQTDRGLEIELAFADSPIHTNTHQAFICSNEEMTLQNVTLWMPSMDHGSAPTRLSQTDPNCAIVNRVFFLMSGDWQFQIQLQSGAQTHAARIDFDVEESE